MHEAQGTSLDSIKDGHPAWQLVYGKLSNLIVVPGHAIFLGHEQSHATQIEYWKGTFQAGCRSRHPACRIPAGIGLQRPADS